MNTIILASLLSLFGGLNNAAESGEIVAASAATSNEVATVEIQSIDTYTLFTNVTAEVISYDNAWALSYTNFDGEAAIATNVVGYLDFDYFATNGVSKIVDGPTFFTLVTTNTVVSGRAPSEVFTQTNTLATIETTNHFGSAVITNAYLFGGPIYISGADENDEIKLIIK